MSRETKSSGYSGLAAAEIRKARSAIAMWLRSQTTSYKDAVMTIGKVAGHLDAAGHYCDAFNHYIGEGVR